jgi:hypothetical protein
VDAKELKTSAEQGAFALVEIVAGRRLIQMAANRAFGLDLEAHRIEFLEDIVANLCNAQR